jgi:small subunit ribosomal protein S11
MPKKTVTTKKEVEGAEPAAEVKAVSKSTKQRFSVGTLYVQATYNNTKLLLTDTSGNSIAASSSGALGFSGAKKGTPFASAKVGELIGDKAVAVGIKDANVVVKGVGAGRESAIRAFSSKGINISAIRDETPIPHNGPKPKKPRRV